MTTMFLFNVICVFILGKYSEGIKENLLTQNTSIVSECTKQENPDPVHLHKLREGVFVNDTKLKCFIKCAVIKLNEMTAKGELKMDIIKSKIPFKFDEGNKTKIMSRCNKKNATDSCDLAYDFFKCLSYEVYKLYN